MRMGAVAKWCVLARGETSLSAERRQEIRARYAALSRSEATQLAYHRAWSAFLRWCSSTGTAALPADPRAVADFVIHLGQLGRARSTIRQALAAIRYEHNLAGLPNPALDPRVREVLAGVLREHGRPERPADPLMPADLRALVAQIRPGIVGCRDLALLTLGLAGGFRRSELRALTLEDLRRERDAVTVLVRRSKTDAKGEGHTRRICRGDHAELCPVRALEAWLSASGISSAWIFRPLDRWGRVQDRPLSARAIHKIVAGLVEAVRKVDPGALAGHHYSPHSLRSGLITAAVVAGKPEYEVRDHVGHRSAQTTARYVRAAKVRTSTVTQGIGL
jgi:integrase